MEQKIFETIINVMSEIGAVTKSKRTEQGNKYMYRGIDDVMNALSPAMTKHKLFVVPEILDMKREDRTTSNGNALIYSICTIRYTFYAVDGSSVTAVVIGEAFDSGDKSINKAMSVAFKYACFQTFCIATEEMKDPDADVHELKGNKPKDDKPTETKPKEQEGKADGFAKHDELVGLFHQEIARTGKSLKYFLTMARVTDAKYIKSTDLEAFISGLKELPAKEVIG